jgi:STIP1 homology and U-box containing protein 1
LDLAKEQGLNFADEVVNVMRLARKKKWILSEEQRLQQEIELQTDLNVLLAAEKDR